MHQDEISIGHESVDERGRTTEVHAFVVSEKCVQTAGCLNSEESDQECHDSDQQWNGPTSIPHGPDKTTSGSSE